MFLYALLAGLSGYGPPSDDAARDAFVARYAEYAAGETRALHQYALEGRPWHPAAFRVARCERVEPAAGGFGAFADLVGGQFCVFEVTPTLDPPFVASGVFVHDMTGWRYYGAFSATGVANYDDPYQKHISGGLKPKPGAIAYDGDRAVKPNDSWRSVYEDAFQEEGGLAELYDPFRR
jgi:hypothetical protein